MIKEWVVISIGLLLPLTSIAENTPRCANQASYEAVKENAVKYGVASSTRGVKLLSDGQNLVVYIVAVSDETGRTEYLVSLVGYNCELQYIDWINEEWFPNFGDCKGKDCKRGIVDNVKLCGMEPQDDEPTCR